MPAKATSLARWQVLYQYSAKLKPIKNKVCTKNDDNSVVCQTRLDGIISAVMEAPRLTRLAWTYSWWSSLRTSIYFDTFKTIHLHQKIYICI